MSKGTKSIRWYNVSAVVLTLVTLIYFFQVTYAVEVPAKIKLKVALWRNNPAQVEATNAMFRQYEAANPGVELELIWQAYGGYHEKMTTLAATGLTPDVLAISRVYLAGFAENRAILPMDDYFKKTKLDIKREVVEIISGMYKGQTYGIPIWAGPGLYMYNRDIIDSLGLAQPASLAKSDKWTWDNYIAMGKKVTQDIDGNGSIDRFMRSTPSTWEAEWVPMVWAWGGQTINVERTKAFFDQPAAVAGIQAWADLALVHHITPKPGERAGSFAGGGFVFQGLFAPEAMNVANSTKNAFVPELVPLPAGPNGMFHIAGGCPLAVSSISKYPEEAMKFSVWYALHSNEWQLVGVPASLQTLRSDYLDYLRTKFSYPEAVVQALSNPTGVEPSAGMYRNEILSAYAPLNKVARGEVSALSGATEMNRLITAILNK